MPKILINEKDETFAGTPGRYGNYAVLITGYIGTPDTSKGGKVVSPDENGVYEFSSKSDFIATIGSATPEKIIGEEIAEYHYGNRMAEHLLNMGYPVVYRPITKISDMDNVAFWNIFRDKASYDFRFISHGLLETCYDAQEHTRLYNRKAKLEEDLKKLAEIEEAAKASEKYADDANGACEDEFAKVIASGYVFAKSDADLVFQTYIGLISEDTGLAACYAKVEEDIASHNEHNSTITTFNNINGHIANLASYRADDTSSVIPGRGDCVALIELDEDCYCEAASGDRPENLIAAGIEAMASSITGMGEYCALTVPSIYYNINGDAVKFPGAFHYLACFMNSVRSGFAEWYAAAGYTRGVSSYPVHHTSVKLGEIAINVLEPRDSSTGLEFACNVIANFRGSYYLWGNRTAAPLVEAGLTAKHFLNIRQLCSTLKKQLYVSCRRFTFDPNSDTLWINFVNSLTPTLDAMKADQGIKDYRILKVPTDQKATLKARVRIIPIEAVEDFDIEITLEDSFGGTTVTAN